MSAIDWDTDYPKHCVRYHGWLPACKSHKKSVKGRELKYFTLCAKQAIDVFMLEMEGVLKRDERGCLPEVVICEKEPQDAQEILHLVRPPLKDAIIVGSLEDILTFEDTEDTKGLPPDAESRDRRIRQLLSLKRNLQRLTGYFPFDVINFDPFGSLVDSRLQDNDLYKAFRRIFELQCGIDSFLLLLTTAVNCVAPDVAALFKEDFERNVEKHDALREALVSQYDTAEYDQIEKQVRRALGVAKSVVIPCAQESNWRHNHQGVYLYRRRGKPTVLLSAVVQFDRGGENDGTANYIEDIARVIERMPACYWPDEAEADSDAKNHLARVVAYRDDFKRDYVT